MNFEHVNEYSLWDTDSGIKVVQIEESLEDDFEYFLRVEADQFNKKDLVEIASFILKTMGEK